MYKLKTPIIHANDERIPTIKKLFAEILGYTEQEIMQFICSDFMCVVAKNLTIEQVELIIKPFKDCDANNVLYLHDENTGKFLGYKEVGINLTKEPPKDHYYDHPVVSRDQLVDPFTQKEKERQENYAKQEREERIAKATPVKVVCPYCKSTDCKKITTTAKAVNIALFGLFGNKRRYQWHCEKCGSDF